MTILSGMQPEIHTRVLLADYAGPSHTAIAALLGDLPGTRLVADVDVAAEILPAVQQVEPDVVIIDDRLLRDEHWTAEDLGARLIVVGMDDQRAYRQRATRLGAQAWVAKERAAVVLPALVPDASAVTQRG